MKNVARRIKSIRELKGMTQNELADILHLPVEQLTDLEDGVTKLSSEQITEFATALEVTEEYLRLGNSQNNTLNNINESALENSSVTTTHSTVTNNYHRPEKRDQTETARLQAQLDRLEQKLDFLLQAILQHNL